MQDGGGLSLYINNSDWTAAGLTSADYPTNWSQLAADAKKLTMGGRVGLTMDPNESRIDAFFYQAGGQIFNPAMTKSVIDSPFNVKALDFLKSMLSANTLAFPAQLNAGGSEEAFGANKAAMVVDGPWLHGSMQADFPSVSYSARALPAGPTGIKASLSFTNCWGIPTKNANLGGAVAFVKFMTSPAQELLFAEQFGPIPSLQTLSSAYKAKFPQYAEVLSALQVGHPDISLAGSKQALTAFNSALAQLATSSPSSILAKAQQNLQAVIDQNG